MKECIFHMKYLKCENVSNKDIFLYLSKSFNPLFHKLHAGMLNAEVFLVPYFNWNQGNWTKMEIVFWIFKILTKLGQDVYIYIFHICTNTYTTLLKLSVYICYMLGSCKIKRCVPYSMGILKILNFKRLWIFQEYTFSAYYMMNNSPCWYKSFVILIYSPSAFRPIQSRVSYMSIFANLKNSTLCVIKRESGRSSWVYTTYTYNIIGQKALPHFEYNRSI